MKKIILFANLLLLSVFLHAQGLENIIVEKYYVSTTADSIGSIGNLAVGSVTYRFYADMLPGYKLQAVFGNPAHELRIATSTSFFNNEDYGNTSPNGISVNNTKKNTVMLDSWISVGAAASGKLGVLKSEDSDGSIGNTNSLLQNSDISIGRSLTSFDGMVAGAPEAVTTIGLTTPLSVFDATSGSGNLFSSNNGAWSALNGVKGPTASNRVLIAQITTNGTLNYKFNIQIKDTVTNTIKKYVAENPQSGEFQLASLMGTLHPATIYGRVLYNNTVFTALGDVTVFLKQGSSVIGQTTSNSQGEFFFNSIADGDYAMDGSTTKVAGGFNSSDALIAMKYFVGLTTLGNLNKSAADVDGSTYINSLDALIIQKRFVGVVNSFTAGTWTFDKSQFTMNGANLTHDLKTLCFGDVNGSYVPVAKQETNINLQQKGILNVTSGQLVAIPFQVDRNLSVGALSLKMNLPENVEFVSVDMLDNKNLVFNAENNSFNLSWIAVSPKEIKKDEVLFTLLVRINNNKGTSDFSLLNDCEIAGFNGAASETINLFVPKISFAQPESGLQVSCSPNPAQQTTSFTINIPADGNLIVKIYSITGELVATPLNEQIQHGIFTTTFDLSGLTAGSYFYVAEMSGVSPVKGKLVVITK